MVAIAGIVEIPVRANTTQLRQGFAEGKTQAQQFDRQVSGSFDRASESSNQMARRVAQGSKQIEAANSNVANSTNLITRGYSGALGAFKAFAAVALAGGGLATTVRTIANFEQSMASVAAITRASGDELKALRDTAKELGATTEFSASQAAEGLRFLGMAGFDAEASMAAIPHMLDLATAASMDLGRAADVTSNIMSAFGLAANEAAKATDVLAAVSSRSNTDVNQLGDAMKFVGPIARGMGIEINDVAAAIGTLGDAGLQGSMAGTGLRRVLSSLANATPQAEAALSRLGLKMTDLDPTTNSLVEIIQQLSDAGIGAADALTIFGDRGAPAILNLVAGLPKLEELTGTLRDIDGESRRMAETMRDNLMGSFRGLLSSLEAVMIAVGEAGLTSLLRGLLGVATVTFRTMAAHMDVIASVATVVGIAMIGAFGPAVLGSIANGFRTMAAMAVTSLNLIRAAILANPLGALAVAVVSVIALMYQWRDSLGVVGEWFDWLYEKAMFILDTIKLALQELGIIEGGSMDININGEEAAGKIRQSFDAGGVEAAEEILKSMQQGGSDAASRIGQAGRGQGQAIQESIVEGSAAGAEMLGEATTEAGDNIRQGLKSGGSEVAAIISAQAQMMSARTATAFEAAGVKLSAHAMEVIGAAADVANLMAQALRLQLQLTAAQRDLMRAQARLANAQARAISSAPRFGGSDGGGGGGSNRRTITIVRNDGAGGQPGSEPPGATPPPAGNPVHESTNVGPKQDIKVVNVWDPDDMVNAMASAKGETTLINFAKANRDELKNILGIA